MQSVSNPYEVLMQGIALRIRCSIFVRMNAASPLLAAAAAVPDGGRARSAAQRSAGGGGGAGDLPAAAGDGQGGDLPDPGGRDRHRQHRGLGQDLRALPPGGDRRAVPEGDRTGAARRRSGARGVRDDRGHLGAPGRDRRRSTRWPPPVRCDRGGTPAQATARPTPYAMAATVALRIVPQEMSAASIGQAQPRRVAILVAS